MTTRNHALFVQGVATGSWLGAEFRRGQLAQQRRAAFMSPMPKPNVSFAARKPSTEQAGLFGRVLVWLDGDPYRIYGLPLRKFILGVVSGLAVITIVLLALLEAGGAINVIPPAWSPPPSPAPSPPPPAQPPHPHVPPVPPQWPPFPRPPPHPPDVAVLASSTCRHVVGGVIVILTNNGRCEDGGARSVASICELGSDHPDCPERAVSVQTP